ncbi:MAG: RNA polymerase factor sigma-54 [Rhodospirillales bacterium]
MAVNPRISQRLEQRLGQSLVMTPQLQQAIKLLQMSNLDVAEFVESELEKNPLLEVEEGGPDDGLDETDHAAQQGDDDGEWEAEVSDGAALDDVNFDQKPGDVDIPDEAAYDTDYENIYNTADSGAAGSGTASSSGGFDSDLPDLEERYSGGISLRDHLDEQIMIEILDNAERLIASYMVECLDDAGYLSTSLEEIADTLDCSVELVGKVLVKVQQLDPAGLFARDLAECLALQLKEKNRYDPAIAVVLSNLDLVAAREFTKLAKLSGVDTDDVADMVAEIKALDPKPATSFNFEPVQPIRPDVLMRRHPSGGWIIDLNPETLPRVLVNNAYHARIRKEVRNREERDYIAEQLQSANWLVKALHQRATTILKVATEIISQQDAFFRHGIQHLRPLVLRDIAEAVEMHESTISRVTANKYMATPRGIFELKYFFTSAINSSTGGDSISAESVRQRIRELIDAEDPGKILSDDKIAAILKKEGMDVARRTVAKYRESLGLGSSVERRRAKSAPK